MGEEDSPMPTQQDSLLWIILVGLAVFVLVPLLMMVFAIPMLGMMGWWGGGGHGLVLSPLWSVGLLLVLFIVLLGIGYLLYRGLVGSQLHDHDPALEELRAAYARGELSEEEYDQRLQRLQRDRD